MEGIIGAILMICGFIGGFVTFAVLAFKTNIYFLSYYYILFLSILLQFFSKYFNSGFV